MHLYIYIYIYILAWASFRGGGQGGALIPPWKLACQLEAYSSSLSVRLIPHGFYFSICRCLSDNDWNFDKATAVFSMMQVLNMVLIIQHAIGIIIS